MRYTNLRRPTHSSVYSHAMHFIWLTMHQNRVWRPDPGPAVGAHSVPPDLLAGFSGRGGEKKGRMGKGTGGREREDCVPYTK